MATKMMCSGVVSCASTVRVMAAGKTNASAKTASQKPTAASSSRRQQDVAAYLETLPGCGPESGLFEGVWDPLSLSAGSTIDDLQDFPLFYNFDGMIQGQAINQFAQVKQGFWEPLLIAIGLAESYRLSVGWSTPTGNNFNTLKDEYEMGEIGFDPLGFAPEDEDDLKTRKTRELNNGRLAMIAVARFVLQEVAEPGVEIFEHALFNTEVGIDKEIGVTPPFLPAYEQNFKK
ncbi:hypothetical protein FOA52_014533 [Chlamydomonas sp. UWO 241]|nr:hypothetical protein FOA52_014533 [Chlamydomonas sp. UWO 241]